MHTQQSLKKIKGQWTGYINEDKQVIAPGNIYIYLL